MIQCHAGNGDARLLAGNNGPCLEFGRAAQAPARCWWYAYVIHGKCPPNFKWTLSWRFARSAQDGFTGRLLSLCLIASPISPVICALRFEATKELDGFFSVEAIRWSWFLLFQLHMFYSLVAVVLGNHTISINIEDEIKVLERLAEASKPA